MNYALFYHACAARSVWQAREWQHAAINAKHPRERRELETLAQHALWGVIKASSLAEYHERKHGSVFPGVSP